MKEVSSQYIIQRAIDEIGTPAEEFYKNKKEVLANWVMDAMRILGNFVMLEDKKKEYCVTEYEVWLPCDYIQEIKVTDKHDVPMKHYDKPFDKTYISNPTVYRYKNNGAKLIFNTKELDAVLWYRGIKFDNEGYVIIPDDEFDSQSRAIVQYIAMSLAKVEMRKGNQASAQLFQFEYQEWHRLCANAGAKRYMPKTLAMQHKIGKLLRNHGLHYGDYENNYNNVTNFDEKYL